MRFTPNTCHDGLHDSSPACDVYRADVVGMVAVPARAALKLRLAPAVGLVDVAAHGAGARI